MEPIKVLLADDEQMIRKAMEFKLKREGYIVISVADGKEALKKIEDERPDIVITDLLMPGHSGLEIVSFVKQNYKNLPVIILTSVGMEKTVIEAFSLGVDDFITKPFSPNELLVRIQKLLRKKEGAAVA